MAEDSGAYRLTLQLDQAATITVGRLGSFAFKAGQYAYIGSAKRALSKRVARHQRLAAKKSGKLHWHIDYLMSHPDCHMIKQELFEAGKECEISAAMARRRGVTIPVEGFGATDCRAGCKTHLYKLPERKMATE
ncbi:GIY-YIG nuclease family protein [Candidatus Reidiella endopervernicosa]|uniref:GIY-YIG nuclease family protein n=1 Tax=Candidatus Reidiella endopervernicosa TaxID=2738883 RepID=UPI001EF11C8F|nr:GIY-YIG nuclease family protein [Candidatus Reidiella endopervernicosa]